MKYKIGNLDLQTMVSREQLVDNASEVSTHALAVLDSSFKPFIGTDAKLAALVLPKSAVVGTNSMQVQIIQADDDALTTNIEVLAQSPAAMVLTEGEAVVVHLNEAVVTKPNLGLRYIFGGTSVTVDAWLVPADMIAVDPKFPHIVDTINTI